MIKKIFIALLIAFVIIQFIRPAKNASAADEPAAVAKVYTVPDSVNNILKKACFDCHSNNTRYPWYNNIQPVTWWLNDHVTKGKKELNFSVFNTYPLDKQARKLKKICKEVRDYGMPLDSYTWIHKDAILSADETNAVINWASALRMKIVTENHIDTTKKSK